MSNFPPKKFTKPRPDAPRLLAYDIISEVNRRNGYSNLLLPQALSSSTMDERDRGFTTELVYGTLRMQGLYDYIFAQISDRAWSQVDDEIVDLARMGAHQIFTMRTPLHAAVSATVDVARKQLGESKGSFINALMRKASAKELDQWLAPVRAMSDDVARLAIEYSHPEWIVSAYLDLLKDISLVEAELSSNNTPARPTLVSWPGASTQEDLVALGAIATEYSPYGARFDGAPGSLELIRHRKAGVQDEGSQLVASVFAKITEDAMSTLDLCAGPGGKAALLSHICEVSGRDFVANEISEPRAKLVKNVIGKFGVIVGDGREIATQGRTFDAILADVPCTGLGALRRRPEVRWRRTLKDLAPLLQLQIELSDAAISVLNPGGFFGYATCSPHFAETSGQVRQILKKHPELSLVDITSAMPDGLAQGLREGALSLWGHRHNTDSMFLAIFQKAN
ncbi:MAG: rRNA cytosine-C5-methyltransferase [Candidatus Planktophila sp.]|nr:rRNA cytosine-C5-methyltransferase [Candidatus Planktophila sp.]MBP7902656.1 rRNA cytosine-C5-methyltransferase [Candidatus Planktophila sp.]